MMSLSIIRLCFKVFLMLAAIFFIEVGSPQPTMADQGWDGGLNLRERTTLTLSVAPDGTKIGPHLSSLSKLTRHFLTAGELNELIETAAQTWIKEINLTIGIVHDEGDPFGTNGLQFDDPRMGDIRIGAIPMNSDTLGLAFDHRSIASGTWSGTILLNTEGKFESADHLLAVLIHEMGHVLGLDHSENEKSVMHPTNKRVVLSEEDKAAIREIYGARRLDPNETDGANNDSVEDATRLRVHGSDEGQIPAIAFGDISSGSDEDWFEFELLSNYEGAISFSIKISENSFLDGTLEVFDENGFRVAHGSSKSDLGGSIVVTVDSNDLTDQLFLRVSSSSTTFNIGSYAVIASFDSNLKTEPSKIASIASFRNSYMRQNDLRDFLRSEKDYFFAVDEHLNDTFANADQLEANPNVPGQYFANESIFNVADKDYFEIDAPQSLTHKTMVVAINSRDFGKLVPSVSVFDENRNPVQLHTIVNGNGKLVVQIDGVQTARRYFVRVSRSQFSQGEFATGNYRITVEFGQPVVKLTNFANGSVDTKRHQRFHSLHVARSQMFHMVLNAKTKKLDPKVTIWATIFDQAGNVVYQVATRPGETRSSETPVIAPGSYLVQIDLTIPESRREIPIIQYSLDGLPNSKSEGPELIDPRKSPFPPCKDNPSGYCYPDGNTSTEPFIWIEGISSDLPNGSYVSPEWQNADELYWPEVNLA